MSDTDLGSFTTLQNGLGVAGLAQVSSAASSREPNGYAGFGLPRRGNTPEPWTRRLADDGLTYYYLNKRTGEQTWTLPDSAYSHPSNVNRLASAASTSSVSLSSTVSDTSADRDPMYQSTANTSPAQSRRRSPGDRDSVYSDGSDIHPAAQDRSVGPTPLQRSIAQARQNGTLELNAAEQAAQSLQDKMSPPHPQSVSELIASVQDAITGVIDHAQQSEFVTQSKQADGMSARVSAVVNAVRNLLYIAALPSGQVPSEYTLDEHDSRMIANQSIQTQLKPAQRKVTATLSKLVLSTRTFRSDSDPSPLDSAGRVEADALELDRALQAFVMDVHRYQRHSRIGSKRVLGAFSTDNIGLGLYGGGAAASWKGFGWVALDEEAEVPTTVPNVDAIAVLKRSFGRLSIQLSDFGTLLRTPRQVTGNSQNPCIRHRR
jgi:son of sevenless-like protein